MAEDEDRRWPDAYLPSADALQHLATDHGLSEAQAWTRLLNRPLTNSGRADSLRP